MRGPALIRTTIAGNARPIMPFAIHVCSGDTVVIDERWF
jgi:hypothetical protein